MKLVLRKNYENDSEYSIGQSESFSRTITDSDVEIFSKLSGDFNSLHMDEIEAAKSIFGRRICHGMLVASYISTVIGNYFPGKGTIYLSQTLDFRKPTYIGDTITAQVTVREIKKKDILVLETNVYNQKKDIVISGEAIVKVPFTSDV